MKYETHKKYDWEGWMTVEELAKKFEKSKRMIQMVIKELADLYREIDKGILTKLGIDEEIIAVPIYRRIFPMVTAHSLYEKVGKIKEQCFSDGCLTQNCADCERLKLKTELIAVHLGHATKYICEKCMIANEV